MWQALDYSRSMRGTLLILNCLNGDSRRAKFFFTNLLMLIGRCCPWLLLLLLVVDKSE